MYHSRVVLSVGGSARYMIRNLRCTVTIDSVLANSKIQNAFLFTVHAIFRHDYPLAVEPASTPRPLVQKILRDSLPIDMLLSVVSFLVVAQSSSEVPEGLMNNPVYTNGDFVLCWALIFAVLNLFSHLVNKLRTYISFCQRKLKYLKINTNKKIYSVPYLQQIFNCREAATTVQELPCYA